MTEQNPATGNVVKSADFKTADDWITRVINDHCVDTNVGAIDPVEEVKDEDGNVTQAAVRGKKGKNMLNVNAIKLLAGANGLVVKDYPNIGMYRMNVGNMLRAAARKRHGLNVPSGEGVIDVDTDFEFTEAPDDFEVNEKKTHNPDGSKITALEHQAAE